VQDLCFGWIFSSGYRVQLRQETAERKRDMQPQKRNGWAIIVVAAAAFTGLFVEKSAGISGPDFRIQDDRASISNEYYNISLSTINGAITSFKKEGSELICRNAKDIPLFDLRFRDSQGQPIDVNAFDAERFYLQPEFGQDELVVQMHYTNIGNMPVSVTVRASFRQGDPLTRWNLSVEHHTEYFIDHIDFPNVLVPNDLPGAGGNGRLFWPAMEGAVIDDADQRGKFHGWFKYKPVEYPYQQWGGYYPGPCPMQFMAYYRNNDGLYLAAHDPHGNIKGIEWYKANGGLQLEYRFFPGAIEAGTYKMPYNIVMRPFDGDWYDAADIYRNWVKSSQMPLPQKLSRQEDLPEWFDKSPVLTAYPVRGTRDLGDMTPNEYFPYTNALDDMQRLSETFDSKIMALLMHWEGTAPWAPPYVWPPFGSEENFLEFIRKMHAKGNLVGVYCSGIAWTMRSNIWDFSLEKEFKEKNLKRIMTVAPDGKVKWSKMCSGDYAQRWSYDMCPANAFVTEVVLDQIHKIVNSGCDYIQYFDQNMGGACYFCYSKNHGHPPAPGVWMTQAMVKLYQKVKVSEEVKSSGRRVLIGCEGAAAEPFLPYLKLNDLRCHLHYWTGRPVPAYAYVYHEYINNFMGNQNTACVIIDIDKSPLNLHQRIAYSFTAGDMILLTLRDKGEVHWDWGTSWDVKKPDQQSINTLVRNLNAWRRGFGKAFLCYGRMEKPCKLTGTYDIPMTLKIDHKIHLPSLFTSRWISPDGRDCQIVVNYTEKQQSCDILCGDLAKQIVRVYQRPSSKAYKTVPVKQAKAALNVPALSAVMVEFAGGK